MSDKVVAFLPCRAGSERVKAKNTRTFAGIEGGLTSIKLRQLVSCPEIDEIVVSTDDPIVMELARQAAGNIKKPIRIVQRPPELARSDASTDDLIVHVSEIIQQGVVLWTHVTSPFADERTYGDAIDVFRDSLRKGRFDSLMSVNRIQTFLWSEDGPVNYDRDKEKWPRSQTLPIWYEANSAIFIAPLEIYHSERDRIGRSPNLYELSFPESTDIDTEEDFAFAEWIWRYEKK